MVLGFLSPSKDLMFVTLINEKSYLKVANLRDFDLGSWIFLVRIPQKQLAQPFRFNDSKLFTSFTHPPS